MRNFKRTLSIVLLMAIIGGLLSPLTVHAARTTIIYYMDEPPTSTTDWSGQIEGENLDTYLTAIQNWEVEDNQFDSVSNHMADYDIRLKGLVALCLNDEDVTSDDDDINPYINVLSLAMSDQAFAQAQQMDKVTIGGDDVKIDLGTDAEFFQDNSFKDVMASTPDENAAAKYSAMARTAAEFIYYADTWRKEVNDYIEQHNGKISNTDSEVLESLHNAFLFAANGNYDNDGDTGAGNPQLFTFIVNLWLKAGKDGDMGLAELYEYCNDPANITVDYSYGDVTLEKGQPLKSFYSVSSESGITSVDIPSMASTTGATEDTKDENAVTYLGYVTIGENIVKGVAYSAGYIPMQTNVYSTAVLNGYDTTWLTDWHYKYGFMRKALYKDTSSTSAMDYYNGLGTSKGNLAVCTLRDFVELGDKDLTLYIDQGFYNVGEAQIDWYNMASENKTKLQTFVGDLRTYVEKFFGIDETSDEYKSEEDAFLTEAYDVDLSTMTEDDIAALARTLTAQSRADTSTTNFQAMVKAGANTSYSDKVRNTISSVGGEYISNAFATLMGQNNYDNIVMSSYDIDDTLDAVTVRTETGAEDSTTDYEYTSYDEYTPLFSFAYVSAIYRSSEAYKVSTLGELDTPVFIASDDVAQVKYSTPYDKSSLLNYALVRNLNSMVQINYTYSMDMDSPVYMDIYGNIITESGLVVIPAACNATLYPDDYCSYMYAIGLFSCYGNDYYIPGDFENVEDLLSGFFKLDEDNNVWLIDGKGISVNGVSVDFSNIEAYVSTTQEALFAAFTSYLYMDDTSGNHTVTHMLWPKWVNIINEVMRGAPLEHIDKELEELDSTSIVNRTSIVAAAKLESLINSLKGTMSNTLLSIPDFTTMDHTEYIVAFLFKILLVAVTIVILIRIYQDAAAGILGMRTFFSSAWAVGLTFASLCLIPAMFELTYYGANKLLLQDEVARICMYNLEKSQSGIEIGVTSTDVPDTTNKIMVQLDWVDVPWYDEISELLFGESLSAVDIARKEAMRSSLVSVQNDVTFYNDGIYMDVEDIFNSVGMDYTFNVGEVEDGTEMVNGLYLYSNGSQQTLSFYSPYYAFLKALTANVNYYNKTHNCYMYTTKLQSGNRLKTVGLCSQYFQSTNFMEIDPDVLHLYEVYDLPKEAWYDNGVVFTVDELELMKQSAWYNNIDSDNVEKRIDIVNEYARDFVADNRELLDKVTDETFIKVMALVMAMKYNQVFGITEANCFEIYNLDSNDLLRLSAASTDDAMLTSPMSYARFVLTVGGESSVYAAAVLVMVMFVGSFVKPICVIISFISVFMSIFVFRVVLRKKTNSLLGYLVTILLLSLTNFMHAVILKISTYLPDMGISMLGCLIFIIIFQIAYLLVLGYVTGIALKDWQNLGADKYEETYESIKAKIRGRKNSNHLSSSIPRYDDNWDYYNALVDQHRERNDTL